MARIAIGGFQHETNCFVPVKTDYSYLRLGRQSSATVPRR